MMPLVARLYFAAERSLANCMYGEPAWVRVMMTQCTSSSFFHPCFDAQKPYTGRPSARMHMPSRLFPDTCKLY